MHRIDTARLSESPLWALQKKFYEEEGQSAWKRDLVPSFVTSNAFVASKYASLILSFASDWIAQFRSDGDQVGNTPGKIYVLDIGAGHGKLGYLIVRQLLRLKELWPTLQQELHFFKYVLTDKFKGNVEYWTSHEKLQPLFKLGVLDVAQYDAEKDTEIHLRFSKEVLAPGRPSASPIVAIFQYVFDTLRHDAFQLRGGVLYEGRCSVTYPANVPAAISISQLECAWEYLPVTERGNDGRITYYSGPNSDVNRVLDDYTQHATKPLSFLLPIGGLGCLRRLRKISMSGVFALVADKSDQLCNDLEGICDPQIAIHGSFSLMVNIDAVRKYAKSTGGLMLETLYRSDSFQCSAFLLPNHSLTDLGNFPELAMAWREMQRFGIETFQSLQKCIKEESKNYSLPLALNILRISCHDPDVFYKFRRAFLRASNGMSESLKHDIMQDAEILASNYFPLQVSKDIYFALGRWMMSLKSYARAIKFFSSSQSWWGEHPITYHNQGLCYQFLDQLDSARECFIKAISLKPSYDAARNWLARVETRMAVRMQ